MGDDPRLDDERVRAHGVADVQRRQGDVGIQPDRVIAEDVIVEVRDVAEVVREARQRGPVRGSDPRIGVRICFVPGEVRGACGSRRPDGEQGGGDHQRGARK